MPFTLNPFTAKLDYYEKGVPGTGDKNYVLNFTNEDILNINHNLNKYPSVTVMDSAGNEVVGGVEYTGLNDLIVTFIGSFSGRVTLN